MRIVDTAIKQRRARVRIVDTAPGLRRVRKRSDAHVHLDEARQRHEALALPALVVP